MRIATADFVSLAMTKGEKVREVQMRKAEGDGLPRRCAPRNDKGRESGRGRIATACVASLAMTGQRRGGCLLTRIAIDFLGFS